VPNTNSVSASDYYRGLRVIAIDGPAGSGKSTVAKMLADALDLEYLDTGAMYRSVAFAVLGHGIDPMARDEVADTARQVVIDLDPSGLVTVDGVDATSAIRNAEVTAAVSVVAANEQVRAEMVTRQREWARKRGGGVMEGRDIGTAVFPDAELKVYLTASPEARASRRALEDSADQQTVADEINRRDRQDSQRASDPLRAADDAFVLDTTNLTINEVVAVLVAKIDG